MFFLTRFLCFHHYFRRTKSQSIRGVYMNNNYKNVIKIYEDDFEFKRKQIKDV